MFYLLCYTVKGFVLSRLEKSYLSDFSNLFASASKVLVCNRGN